MEIYFLYKVVNAFFTVMFWVILAHIILSWIPSTHPVIQQISAMVESIVQPIFRPLRKIVPVVDLGGAGFDLTPLVSLILLRVLQGVILTFLRAFI